MNRTKNYEEMVSKKLQKSLKFRQSFLLSFIEDHDMAGNEALKETIRCMGLREFSDLSGLKIGHVGDFLQGRRKLKQETLNRYLKPFDLKVKLVFEKAA